MEEIYLKRPHSEIPWGFRIVGGAESQLPIIVSKVLKDSIAETSGLEEEVILERVNNVPTSSLTHSEVNEIIIAAGNELLFTIKRENLENYLRTSPNPESKEKSTRIYSIEENDEEENEVNSFSHQGPIKGQAEGDQSTQIKREYGIPMIMDNQNKLRELTSYLISPSYNQEPSKYKKWSTFLQKPKNPPPRPFNEPPPIPKDKQYRVVIKKGKKNYEIEPHESQEIKTGNEPDENAIEPFKIDEADLETENDGVPVNLEEVDKDLSNIQQNASPVEVEETLEEIKLINVDNNMNSGEDIKIREIEECPDDPDTEEIFEGLMSETAEMEGALSEILSDIHEESEQLENIEENDEEKDENVEKNVNENEFIKNEESHYEASSESEDDNEMKKSVIRPIVLPGGRKWMDPEDVVPMKIKTRRMSDNTICSTIETFSEVIVGKTKGINFMKYTPPAKNLDYLQKSAVYRLIHEMEPPVKGISVRPEKVLAEQDYYSDDDK